MQAPVILVRMTPSAFDAWLLQAIPAFAADKIASGQWPAADALALSRQAHEELLPQGMGTAGHHFFTVSNAVGVPLGMLWFAVESRFGLPIAYVYNIAIDQAQRRKGHAQHAFEALEREAAAMGLHGIALHVFGHNAAARALYAKLGYEPTNLNLFKQLPRAAASPAS